MNFLSIADQIAAHLHAEILRGRWATAIPGRHQLAAEFGVNSKTVEAALRQLEKTGVLVPQGAGRPRLIHVKPAESIRELRIGFLHLERHEEQREEHLIQLWHALAEAGHQVVSAQQTLTDMQFDVKRVAAVVGRTMADAWIVCAGSRGVLEWFARQPLPTFALFGQREGLPMAAVGPDKPPALVDVTRRLVALGHRRIVLMCRKLRRLPTPGTSEKAFLAALHEGGIPAGDYNLPDWEETPGGFHDCLDALFRLTPPTALIVDETAWFIAAMNHLLRLGLRVPDDVSMVSTDDHPTLHCCHPPVARIAWDSGPVIRRILKWAHNISHGRPDIRQSLTPSRFIPGGTIGPAPVPRAKA